MSSPAWNDRYLKDDLPWDTGSPDPHLVALFDNRVIPPGRALDIGCGTGTNALWLAGRGFAVTGIDVSERAIELAVARQTRAGIESGCTFAVIDFLEQEVPGGPFDLVFDRGCFHTFDHEEDRARFAAQVAAHLAPDGRWVSLIGSTEGPDRDHGPPRRSLRNVAQAVEPVLHVAEIRSVPFHSNVPSPVLGWLMTAIHRVTPAVPSTRRG